MASIKSIILVLLASAVLVAALVYWASGNQNAPSLRQTDESFNGPFTPEEQRVNDPANTNTMNPTATFTTNQGTFTLELYRDQMPITVGNFVELAQSGFYNNTKFHRVIDGFMIQGGDPNSKSSNEASYGTGGPGYTIEDEFVAGEGLTNVRGTISMANTGQPNSGGSQFFINVADNTNLDFDKQPLTSKHPVFGRIVEGMDVIDAISKVETKAGDVPVTPVVIESVTITEG